ncbi:hypothetical protein HPB48_001589 [Haemaphysalis longicornis]|uniref:AMP-dependent synthetase/ligase domain-containing protein n=1 Tax=Haemaphysalis longicornis TaxID=44386 RepID=A0A9J6GD06_HAELO|nr:hypothetical protein HPB48_001589 [Haemaphysalis longicornis]
MMTPKSDVHRVAQLVSKYKATAAVIPSTRLQSLAGEMRHFGIRLSSIRRLGASGSVLSEAAYSVILSAFDGVECLVNAYALTEAMGFLSSPSVHDARGTDVGFPAPWAQIKVVDEQTQQRLGANQTGEICFRTPSMMKEYYKKPKETAEIFDEDGWCKSGDAGFYDGDGRLHIVQRLKEMIKCMDNQVVPAELEDLLLTEHSEEISEVAVVGLPQPHYGEAPAALAVPQGYDSGRDYGSLADLAERMKATIAG